MKMKDRVRILQERVQQHESQAHFTELFDLLAPSLCGYARQYVTPEEAEEAVYLIFTRLWQNRSTLDKIDNLQVYLFRAVRFEVGKINQRKKGAYFSIDTLEESHLRHTASESPYSQLLESELKAVLDEAIEQLPPQCKATFKLVKEQGMKYKEAAEALGISKNTVENHLVKALKILKKTLREYDAGKKGSASRFKIAGLNIFSLFFGLG